MRKAIIIGLFIYIIIRCSYLVGCEKLTTDKDYAMPERVDTAKPAIFDTARHYKQDFTPFSKKNKVVQIER